MPVGVPPLTAEQSKLASLHYPLALRLAAKWAAKRPDLAVEIVSAASLGLVDAARLYNPGCNDSFPAFASIKIKYAIKDFLGDESRRRKIIPLDEAMATARIAPGGSGDGNGNGNGDGDALRDFGRLIAPLPPRQRMVLRLMYVDGRTQREIASMSGFSKCSIIRTHRAAIVTLRKILGGDAACR